MIDTSIFLNTSTYNAVVLEESIFSLETPSQYLKVSLTRFINWNQVCHSNENGDEPEDVEAIRTESSILL